MAYWWVNQGQTFEEEFRGSYLWAPKLTKNGQRRRHWDAMKDVRVDDVIVHYEGKPRFELRSVSVALAEAVDTAQPVSLQQTNMWDDDGWLVSVAHVDEVAPLHRDAAVQLGPKEAPFTTNGQVKQGYLWPLSTEFGRDLVERMDPAGAGPSTETGTLESLAGPLTVELEAGRELTFEQVLTQARREAVRSEWQLVDEFVAARGLDRLRRRYQLPSGHNLFADAWFPKARVLVEAKASSDRRSVREAIGQLYDYAQKEDGPVKKVVVLPEAPADDLLEVLRNARITAIWRTPSGWSDAFHDETLWSAP